MPSGQAWCGVAGRAWLALGWSSAKTGSRRFGL